MKLLHQAGASLTEVDDAGYYPISVLFQNQDLEESLQILKYLLENGANVHVKDYETEDSLLHNCGGIFSIFGYFFVGVFEPWDSQFFFYSHQYFWILLFVRHTSNYKSDLFYTVVVWTSWRYF